MKNVNGWSIIEHLLDKRGRNQSWLARKLDITPAAITQIKHGLYRLSGEQLRKVCSDLGASKKERCELYTAIVTARFCITAEVTVE